MGDWGRPDFGRLWMVLGCGKDSHRLETLSLCLWGPCGSLRRSDGVPECISSSEYYSARRRLPGLGGWRGHASLSASTHYHFQWVAAPACRGKWSFEGAMPCHLHDFRECSQLANSIDAPCQTGLPQRNGPEQSCWPPHQSFATSNS